MKTPRQTQEERLVVSSFSLSFRIGNLLVGNRMDPQCSTRHHPIAAPRIETMPSRLAYSAIWKMII